MRRPVGLDTMARKELRSSRNHLSFAGSMILGPTAERRGLPFPPKERNRRIDGWLAISVPLDFSGKVIPSLCSDWMVADSESAAGTALLWALNRLRSERFRRYR